MESNQNHKFLFLWMCENLLFFSSSEKIWQISELRYFLLSLMQNLLISTSSATSVSSFSNQSEVTSNKSYKSIERKQKTPKSGTIVHIFERDSSTFAKKEIIGGVYVWGRNSDGQLGLNEQMGTKILFPRFLLSLKESIIIRVACGLTHCLAISINKSVFAWGCNSSFQLGIGKNSAKNVLIPTLISNLTDIVDVILYI